MLNEYRCTNDSLYPEGTPYAAKQGHYIIASSIEEALSVFRSKFPKAKFYSAMPWKTNLNPNFWTPTK